MSTNFTVGVSGARGVIGRNLIHLANDIGGIKLSEYHGDILDFESARLWAEDTRPNLVIHLAAIVPTASVERAKEKAEAVNKVGPSTFARAVLSGVKGNFMRFIYASTSHVYASSNYEIPEHGMISPQNFYAHTKLAGEFELQQLEAANENFDLLVSRIFSVYSEDQARSFLFPALCEKILGGPRKQEIELVGWNNTRDFLHAEQVAHLLLLLGKSSLSGIVNLRSGIGQTIKAFAENTFEVELRVSEQHAGQNHTTLIADTSLISATLGRERFESIAHRKLRLNFSRWLS
jgi:nucleoside-diphosphate-sugar epimerase